MASFAPLRLAQRRAGLALRANVAGENAEAEARKIWGTPGPRWFTESDPISRVQTDATMFPAGVTALLLQSLHPLAMAGVADHSGYRGDPWPRLVSTSTYVAITTAAPIAYAEETIAKVRRVHERIVGVAPDGRPYSANDPHLLEWVHVAQIWSFLTAHQRLSPTPLDPVEADTYVAQAAIPARLLGALDLPESVAQLEDRLAAFRPELAGTPAARDTADFLLYGVPMSRAARLGYAPIAAGGVALLPEWARAELGLRTGGVRATAGLFSGRASSRMVRWALAGVADDQLPLTERAAG